MLNRLGNVIYWLGCVLASGGALLTLCMAYGMFHPTSGQYSSFEVDFYVFITFAVLSSVPWIAGWSARYVLSGRTK